MTLIVGFQFVSYALIVADSRITYHDPDGAPYHRDDEEKICQTALGLITGAGLADLLDPVKERLASEAIENTDDVIQIITQARTALESRPWIHDDRVQESLKSTAWMLTYLGAGPVPELRQDSSALRVAFTVPERGYKFALLQPNTFWNFPPTGATPEEVQSWHMYLADQVRPLRAGQRLLEHVLHHVSLAAALVEEVASVNEGVASTFQVGVHALPSDIMISEIVGRDGTTDFRWKDSTWIRPRPGEMDDYSAAE